MRVRTNIFIKDGELITSISSMYALECYIFLRAELTFS